MLRHFRHCLKKSSSVLKMHCETDGKFKPHRWKAVEYIKWPLVYFLGSVIVACPFAGNPPHDPPTSQEDAKNMPFTCEIHSDKTTRRCAIIPYGSSCVSLLCIARVELGIILFGGYNSDPDPYVPFTPIMHSKIPRCFCRKMIQSNQHGDEFQAVSMALKSDTQDGRSSRGRSDCNTISVSEFLPLG